MFNKNFFKDYCDKVKPLIWNKLSAKRTIFNHKPTLFERTGKAYAKKLEVAYYIRQDKMREGYVGQILLGNWEGWQDLNEIGVSTREKMRFKIQNANKQPDIWKIDNTAIAELKNNFNTAKGGDIKKTIYEPLAEYRKQNPNATAIWGIINPEPGNTQLTEKIVHKGVEIIKLQGVDLFKYVCVYENYDYTNDVIKFGQKVISDFYNSRGNL